MPPNLLKCIIIIALLCMAGASLAQEIREGPESEAGPKLGPPLTVHGRVLNAVTGEPIAHALVSTDADTVRGALTDGQGNFEIPDVPSGLEEFTIKKPGFRSGSPANKQESTVWVRLANPMPDLLVKLHPTGTLDGQVQLSTGDSASHFRVELLRRTVRGGRSEWAAAWEAITDDYGIYHFSNLLPGTYTLHSAPQLENPSISPTIDPLNAGTIRRRGYPAVYYPNVRTAEGAVQIQIGPGEQATANLSLALEPFYPVTVAILAPNGQPFVPALRSDEVQQRSLITVHILDVDNRHSGYPARYDAATGTIQADLPDGIYTIRVFVNADAAGKPAMGNSHAGYLMGLAPITISGHALRNLPMALFAPSTHSLILHRPAQAGTSRDGPPPTDFNGLSRVWFSPAGDPLETTDSEIEALRDGDAFNLMFNPVSPQWLHTRAEHGYCTGAVSGGGIDPVREPLVSNPAGPNPPLEIQIRNDCAQLTLKLPATETAEAPGIVREFHVFVVPDFETTDDAREATISALQERTVEVDSLTPGSYHIYTSPESSTELPYRDPATMAQLQLSAQAITLHRGDKAQLILDLSSNP
jgi:hypothetical protein